MDAVLGTAGHIDHGKTSLVRALTGINCDRLDEEQRRGITIELGFAWLDLPDKRRLGIVDVPGHERFVKNMVAGAAGIDCVMLVIAADEGVMPQTREHLEICSMLGLTRGLVALTKTDCVEPDWLEMVREDTREALQGTFLQDAPIIPVSSATGHGLEELRAAIWELVASLQPRAGTDIFRLPVDRAFSLKGFGTVVTGSIVSGSCSQGELVAMAASQKQARARSLQVHGVPVDSAHQGQRCAINLQGVEVADVPRGEIITTPGALFPSTRWITRLTCLDSAPAPIRQRTEAHFHHLAQECAARIVFFDRTELAPGETAIAELRLEQPVAGVFGDHFVLRSRSPLRAIAGGVVLDPLPGLLRQRDPLFSRKISLYRQLGQTDGTVGWEAPAHDPVSLLKLALAVRDLPGADFMRLRVLTALKTETLERALSQLAEAGSAFCWDGGSQWVGKDTVDQILDQFVARANELHEREPLKAVFSPNALFPSLPADVPQKFLQGILEVGITRNLFAAEGNGVRLASWEVRPDAQYAKLIARTREIYEQAGQTPPMFKEVQGILEAEPKTLQAVLAHLCQENILVKVHDGMYFPKPVVDEIVARIPVWFETHAELDAAGMKSMFGLTRKYTIPLLEYLDQIKVTYRVGDKRRLRK